MRSVQLRIVWTAGLALSAAFLLGGMLFAMPKSVSSQVFVTNTPAGPDPLAVSADAPIEQYAMRLWTEGDLINTLASQIRHLNSGDLNQADAIRLTQYELQRRFPGAPHNSAQREQLLNLMTNAPRGTVDMRAVVRPAILDALNQRLGDIAPNAENTLTIDNFLVQTSPVNLDADGVEDAMLYIRYPADAGSSAEALYEDYTLMLGQPDRSYSFGSSGIDIPAAPFGDIETVSLVRLGDVNLDGLDELAISVDRGDVNNEMYILGGRNDSIVSLVQPGQRIEFGELISWTESDSTAAVANYRPESERWDCVSEIVVEWRWSSSFYRPSTAENASYRPLDSIGCGLLAIEPVFANEPAVAISNLQNVLDGGAPGDPGYERGLMAIAMLRLLNGERERAEEQIASIFPMAEGNEWLSGQIEAFATTAAQESFSPVQVCAALIRQNPNGACDVDQVLQQVFTDDPILRDGDVREQLEALGLPVLEMTTVAQIGRLDRQVVNFNLTGASWWAFAPTNAVFYVPSPTDPPMEFEAATLPVGFIDAPRSAYDAFYRGDWVATLNLIDNAMQNTTGSPLAPSARYLEALSRDLLSDRQGARQAYYSLWTDFAGNAWGQLAGAHLERR